VNTDYPGKLAELGDPAWLREQRLVPLRFYPFQYNPSKGALSVYRSITVRIDFQYPKGLIRPAQKPTQTNSSASPFEGIYQESLLNYDQAKNFRERAPVSDLIKPLAESLNQTSSNPRYKITITEDGIYRISYETLHTLGFPLDSIDPRTFSMTNQGRPVAIYVDDSGGHPDKFEPGEFILFYGQHFDGTYLASLYADEAKQWRKQFIHPSSTVINWSPQFNYIMMEKYTNKNVYWLSYGDGNTVLMEAGMPATSNCYEVYLPLIMKNSSQSQSITSEDSQVVSEFNYKCHPRTATSFREKIHVGPQLIWRTTHFTSEDTFFWDWVTIDGSKTLTYTISITNPLTTSAQANILGEFVGYSNNTSINPDHHEIIYLNSQTKPIADLAWDGLIKYDFNIPVTQNKLISGDNSIQVTYALQPGRNSDSILLNWLEIQYERMFIASKNQLQFTGDIFGTWRYTISGFTGQKPWLMDITDPLNPILLTDTTYTNGTLSFEMTHRQNEKFIAANPIDLQSNQIELSTPAIDLLEPADYIFITHPDFIQQVQLLANYRNEHDGFVTKVVNVDDLYDEFNFGIYHPIAIKNYLNYIYHNWQNPPTYVLLVGDGHWNFQGSTNYDNPKIYMPPNLSWVDPWQGEVDSSSLLAAVDGDDPLPDMFIGRLPVQSSDQINSYLQKIIYHENHLNDTWQQTNTFIADK
ncbi:MAG: C25 family cysteine peptidase, partial [Candidatus Kryptoniota bacterium]